MSDIHCQHCPSTFDVPVQLHTHEANRVEYGRCRRERHSDENAIRHEGDWFTPGERAAIVLFGWASAAAAVYRWLS